MRTSYGINATLFSFIILFGSCNEKPSIGYQQEKKEIESFLDNYKRLLQSAKFDSVALLYVDTGFMSMGNGQIEIQTIDSIKSFYSRMPKILNDFRWGNTRIDVLSKNSALVTSFFYWHNKNEPDKVKQCYTGVFIKKYNDWKIMHEHESLDITTMAKIIKQSKRNSK